MRNHSAVDRGDGTDGPIESARKVAATCTDCGRTYACTERADGMVHPIGRPSGCQCGNTAFEVLRDEPNAE